MLNPGTQLADHAVETRLGPNRSDTELLYEHRDGVTNPQECGNVGRQLINEHRRSSYRCDYDEQTDSYHLYVS